jgi:hypothetical protein
MDKFINTWHDLHWRDKKDGPTAYCPTHTGMELDVLDDDGDLRGQHHHITPQEERTTFVCPVDDRQFIKNHDLYTLRRRYSAYVQSQDLKNAKILDLDNILYANIKSGAQAER